MDNSVPCYGCKKRVPLCHGSCEDYKRYREERVERADMIRKKKADEAMMDDVRFKAIKKAAKLMNKQTAWKGK